MFICILHRVERVFAFRLSLAWQISVPCALQPFIALQDEGSCIQKEVFQNSETAGKDLQELRCVRKNVQR